MQSKVTTNHRASAWPLSAGPCRMRRPLCILCCHMNTLGLLMKPWCDPALQHRRCCRGPAHSDGWSLLQYLHVESTYLLPQIVSAIKQRLWVIKWSQYNNDQAEWPNELNEWKSWLLTCSCDDSDKVLHPLAMSKLPLSQRSTVAVIVDPDG